MGGFKGSFGDAIGDGFRLGGWDWGWGEWSIIEERYDLERDIDGGDDVGD